MQEEHGFGGLAPPYRCIGNGAVRKVDVLGRPLEDHRRVGMVAIQVGLVAHPLVQRPVQQGHVARVADAPVLARRLQIGDVGLQDPVEASLGGNKWPTVAYSEYLQSGGSEPGTGEACPVEWMGVTSLVAQPALCALQCHDRLEAIAPPVLVEATHEEGSAVVVNPPQGGDDARGACCYERRRQGAHLIELPNPRHCGLTCGQHR